MRTALCASATVMRWFNGDDNKRYEVSRMAASTISPDKNAGTVYIEVGDGAERTVYATIHNVLRSSRPEFVLNEATGKMRLQYIDIYNQTTFTEDIVRPWEAGDGDPGLLSAAAGAAYVADEWRHRTPGWGGPGAVPPPSHSGGGSANNTKRKQSAGRKKNPKFGAAGKWACAMCTYLNSAAALTCEQCRGDRPAQNLGGGGSVRPRRRALGVDPGWARAAAEATAARGVAAAAVPKFVDVSVHSDDEIHFTGKVSAEEIQKQKDAHIEKTATVVHDSSPDSSPPGAAAPPPGAAAPSPGAAAPPPRAAAPSGGAAPPYNNVTVKIEPGLKPSALAQHNTITDRLRLRAIRKLRKRNGRNPTDNEINEYMGDRRTRAIKKLKEARGRSPTEEEIDDYLAKQQKKTQFSPQPGGAAPPAQKKQKRHQRQSNGSPGGTPSAAATVSSPGGAAAAAAPPQPSGGGSKSNRIRSSKFNVRGREPKYRYFDPSPADMPDSDSDSISDSRAPTPRAKKKMKPFGNLRAIDDDDPENSEEERIHAVAAEERAAYEAEVAEKQIRRDVHYRNERARVQSAAANPGQEGSSAAFKPQRTPATTVSTSSSEDDEDVEGDKDDVMGHLRYSFADVVLM